MLLNSLRWEGRSSILRNKKTPTLCAAVVVACWDVLISLMVKHLDGRGLSLTRTNLATLETPQLHTQAAQVHLLLHSGRQIPTKLLMNNISPVTLFPSILLLPDFSEQQQLFGPVQHHQQVAY